MTLSNPAKLLRGYISATGTTDSRELAAALDIPLRTIQRLKLEVAGAMDGVSADAKDAISGVCTNNTSANDAMDGAGGAPKTPYMARAEATRTVEKSPRVVIPARATFESLRDESYQEVKQDPPLVPQGGKKDDLQPTHERVQFVNGRLTLFNGLKAFWLEKFDGDADRLDLALIQAAGFIQPHSTRPLEAQVSSQLARSAADKRDRDKRYAAAAKASGKPTKAQDHKPITIEPDRMAELQRRADFYRQIASENDSIMSGGSA